MPRLTVSRVYAALYLLSITIGSYLSIINYHYAVTLATQNILWIKVGILFTSTLLLKFLKICIDDNNKYNLGLDSEAQTAINHLSEIYKKATTGIRAYLYVPLTTILEVIWLVLFFNQGWIFTGTAYTLIIIFSIIFMLELRKIALNIDKPLV